MPDGVDGHHRQGRSAVLQILPMPARTPAGSGQREDVGPDYFRPMAWAALMAAWRPEKLAKPKAKPEDQVV